MQNILFKIITIIFISLFTGHTAAISQELNYDLHIADSLFEKGKFTESFGIYESILTTAEQYSPAMLLRMAYIKEGLGDHSSALYFLNMYHLKTYDKYTLEKMEMLANKNDLEGYQTSDLNPVVQLMSRYYETILISLAAIALLLLGAAIFVRFRMNKRPLSLSIATISILALIFFFTNFVRPNNFGIITTAGGFVMSGPSAGSTLIDAPSRGHKVKILGKKDVWTIIDWKGETAYIKSQYIQPFTI